MAEPSGERWHARSTPVFGGVGIFAGLVAGIGAAVAVGAIDASSELLGIVAGCTILFLAGLVDDLRTLRPLAKLAAQFAAAGIVLVSGLTVEIIGNDVLATTLGLVWLVGITNAFNLLDNMDGLAASLAAVSCAVFAVDAIERDAGELGLVVALALGGACLGFLPFNLRPGRERAVFMGDSGSQVLGFGLASLALASSWTTAGATLTARAAAARARDPDPRHDARHGPADARAAAGNAGRNRPHVAPARLLRPLRATGRAGLTLLAALLGATGLAYTVLANPRVTAVGVLVSFVVLVQFASFLTDLEERSRHEEGPPPALWRALVSIRAGSSRCSWTSPSSDVSFLAAYLLFVDGKGTLVERAVFLSTLPVLLGVRYVLFVAFGIYRRVWRFAGPRDLVAIALATTLSAPIALGIVAKLRPLYGFPLEIFLVDVILCTTLVAASRLALRARLMCRLAARSARRGVDRRGGSRGSPARPRVPRGRGPRVVGFVDDNPSVRVVVSSASRSSAASTSRRRCSPPRGPTRCS